MTERKARHTTPAQFTPQSPASVLSSPPHVFLLVIQLLLLAATLLTLDVGAQLAHQQLPWRAQTPLEPYGRRQNYNPFLRQASPRSGQVRHMLDRLDRGQQKIRRGAPLRNSTDVLYQPPVNRVESPCIRGRARIPPTPTSGRSYDPLHLGIIFGLPMNGRDPAGLLGRRYEQRTFFRQRHVPAPADAHTMTDWADPQKIRPLDAGLLYEGKQVIARTVKAAQRMDTYLPSFLALHMSPRSNLRVAEGDQLKRNHEDDEEPSEETGIWDTAATRQWMKPIRSHHFRTDDFIAMGLPSGAQHESKDSNWPLNTAAFVETPSGVNQWTRPVGFLNAVKWFWPQGTIAKVVDDRGITHSLTWRKLLGVGGMGGVLFVEDEDEPLTSPLKRFAGKIIYQQSEPSYELSQAKKYLYQIRDEEIGVASLFEQAALSLHDCPPTTAGRMRFLFKKGFVLPQTMFRLEGTTQAPRLGDIVEASPEIVGSPDGLLMRLDPHVIAYPILGPDLENLEVPEWNLSTITYTIYKLTHLMATMQEMNLVHTDVKAENFLAGDDGELFVADLAMAVKAGPATLTPCFQGTVSYLDPKVAACAGRYGSQSPTAKRDAYALGVTFYKLLCRRKPFQLEQLEHEATEQDQKRQPSYSGALHLLSGISKLRRKDWVERECPIADESLLTITKLLLDPQGGNTVDTT